MGENLRKLSRILCRKLNVKITRGSPYHPLSQGKVERSHRSLLPKVGLNRVFQLKEYQRILNELPMDVLGNQSPFEVFFMEENLILWQGFPGCFVWAERRCTKGEDVIPKNNDLSKKAVCTDKKRAKAKAASTVWDNRYIKRKLKNNHPSVYSVGETVLVRFPFTRTSRVGPKGESSEEKPSHL